MPHVLMPHPALRFSVCAWLLLALCACDTVGVKRAYTALDGDGNRKRSVFSTDTESIFCTLELASGVADVTVTAELRAKRLYDRHTGEPVPLDTIVGAEEQAPGVGSDIHASFLIKKPAGESFYPAGEFSCELFVDGKREATLDFEVRFPDCPFRPIENRSSCAGAVLFGSDCPGPIGDRCVCAEDEGLWNCK